MSAFDYQLSTITKYRSGKSGDPFIPVTQSEKIINQQVLLNELPDRINGVQIDGYFEVKTIAKSGISGANFYVDYNEGIVTFSNEKEGETVIINYLGRGNHYISSHRVWHTENNGEVTETLGDIIEVSQSAIANLEQVNEAISNEESSRVAAESGRVSAETLRANTETSRGSNEATRQADETSRVNAESSRVIAENNRATEESLRVTSETNRVVAETNRVNAENARVSNEATRETNETNRNNAETARVSAESTRASSETTRQSQESARQTAINNFHSLGEWDSSTSYQQRNIVTYNDSSYMCTVANTNVLPTDTSKWQVIALKGKDGTGTGDMSKSVYDTNDNGKVDSAETADSVPWTGITSKPASFPPEVHNHDDRYYTEIEVDSILSGKQDSLGYIPVNKSGDVMSGFLEFLATKGLVFNTAGNAKGRLHTLPGVPDWLGFTLNASFNGSGWVLDDPSLVGWFFKLDSRAGLSEFAVYRIPTGSGTHTDETQLFTVKTDGSALLSGNAIYHAGNQASVSSAEKSTWSGKADASTLNGHIAASSPHSDHVKGSMRITCSTAAPTTPTINDMWIDIN